MKVVSWNIMHGLDVEGAIDALSTYDRLCRPDLLLLQEMDEAGTATMADALDLNYAYAAASVHPKSGRDFGNAILSPFPLIDDWIVELPHKARAGGQPRIAAVAVTRIEGHDVTVCSTHTEIPALSAAKRQEQFATLAAAASRWPTDQVVVGGDFNTVTRKGVRKLVNLFEDVDFSHVSIDAITTLRRIGQNFTLDHLFARGLWPVESGVVRGLDVSDHAPIWVTLEPGSTEDPAGLEQGEFDV